MTILQLADIDPRRFKKDWGSAKANERDWQDFQYQHQLELHYEAVARRDFLHHYYGVRAWDLIMKLKRLYLLGTYDLARVMKFLIHNDKYIEVQKIGEDQRYWNLYLFPRTPNLIKYPHSFLKMSYYEEMCKSNNNK